MRSAANWWRSPGTVALATALVCLVVDGASPAAAAGARVSGAGSTTAYNQLDSWIYAIRPAGVTVDYDPQGATYGRANFRSGTTDFAVSELPYGIVDQGVTDPPPARPFAYLPVTAGAVAFPYNLVVNGRRVTDLRLSSAAVAGIFTRSVTRWNDPVIVADNPGLALPDLPIRPAVRSDGNATSFELTRWLAAEQPAAWDAHCSAVRGAPCGGTAYFPAAPGTVTALGSALSVAAFVANQANNGSIGYTNASYAAEARVPTARVLNGAGYYTAPTPGAVAVGLTAATVTPGEPVNLSGVRTGPDPRAYPLPVVSHLIVPTSEVGNFTAAKGESLGVLARYGLCHQGAAVASGDAPLAPGLIAAGLQVLPRIPGVPAAGPDPSACAAPSAAVIGNTPPPLPCDRLGAPACATDAPSGVVQRITVDLAPGALVVSVAGPPRVVLPQAALDPAGDWFRTGGPITPVTVTDTRPGNLAWSLSGQASDFAGPTASAVIAARHLGWAPAVLDRGTIRSVTPGPPVPPGTGLDTPRTLSTGTGPGTTRAGADLTLEIPTSTPPGTYTSVLTLTAI
ncbi:ABC-type phosphate transport system substrate-binding protein [Kitasatospora gansuensis]|uniref:ABC-type phosphate transport system substrate-binding protein n=1 Tax=Kitasatospora gansuensis TaxID=258050 RepID=A0A7W7SJ66_9ACTN|nr:substrate-binding domain-containing protein [Kitasatospora gansuensis]MBB4951441.1 ABC-type phosphate transport system substrate-binding protein [Kitasatospora gansuensis]